ncbi:hypothetical protein ROT00_00095 [Agromyces mediolanus]|uniref:hypothetical protein n=1 Tax=Agromyces mediolanus TaxID=41986 RepID=UPI003832F662
MDFATTIDALRRAGWVYGPPLDDQRPVPRRLLGFPAAFGAWSVSFSRLSNADDDVWFLSVEDYLGTSESAFAWNEFERLSLEAAAGPEQAAAVTAFWAGHLPFLHSVRDDYEYLAIASDGRVVHGREPEFEETTTVADDLPALLAELAGVDGPRHPLAAALFAAR